MRRLVLMLLLLGLSLPAWAGLLTFSGCCPSTADRTQGVVEDTLNGGALPDCCNDLATYLQTGQTCKAGTSASAPLLGWPAMGTAASFDLALRATPPAHAPAPRSTGPDSIWRPPL